MYAAAMIVSKNRLEGSFSDTSLKALLDACHKHLVTGAIKIESGKKSGVLVLRAGAVDQARFGDSVGDAAVDAMLALEDGSYELSQQLPDLSGELGRAAALEGAVDQVSVVQIMRHCENNALSAVITVINDFDRGEIHYRAGELEKVMLNGERNDDAIVAMLAWPKARYRVSAPPLASEIGGWPKVGREQTQPFVLQKDESQLPPQAVAARKKEAEKQARLPRPRTNVDEGFTSPEAAATQPAAAAERKAEAMAPRPAPRRGGMASTLLQAFLLTLAATLVLTFVALLASR
jgi:hypothetical protein